MSYDFTQGQRRSDTLHHHQMSDKYQCSFYRASCNATVCIITKMCDRVQSYVMPGCVKRTPSSHSSAILVQALKLCWDSWQYYHTINHLGKVPDNAILPPAIPAQYECSNQCHQYIVGKLNLCFYLVCDAVQLSFTERMLGTETTYLHETPHYTDKFTEYNISTLRLFLYYVFQERYKRSLHYVCHFL